MALSPTMINVVEQMKSHGELIRYPGGFWSWRGVEIKHMQDYDVPAWYCDIKTLRALGKRGIVSLDEISLIPFYYEIKGNFYYQIVTLNISFLVLNVNIKPPYSK